MSSAMPLGPISPLRNRTLRTNRQVRFSTPLQSFFSIDIEITPYAVPAISATKFGVGAGIYDGFAAGHCSHVVDLLYGFDRPAGNGN